MPAPTLRKARVPRRPPVHFVPLAKASEAKCAQGHLKSVTFGAGFPLVLPNEPNQLLKLTKNLKYMYVTPLLWNARLCPPKLCILRP